uniref:HTH psq-type domain-containing protein n=1 Tax=Timema douglasi TaxID=61478 RepID=A0A7R8VRY3_TIMDO|nr:unnamed protein product [Timema douglasi]
MADVLTSKLSCLLCPLAALRTFALWLRSLSLALQSCWRPKSSSVSEGRPSLQSVGATGTNPDCLELTFYFTSFKMRNYKRKSDRGKTDVDVLEKAAQLVREGTSIRQCAKSYNICHVTLTRYISRKNKRANEPRPDPEVDWKPLAGYYGNRQVFTPIQETALDADFSPSFVTDRPNPETSPDPRNEASPGRSLVLDRPITPISGSTRTNEFSTNPIWQHRSAVGSSDSRRAEENQFPKKRTDKPTSKQQNKKCRERVMEERVATRSAPSDALSTVRPRRCGADSCSRSLSVNCEWNGSGVDGLAKHVRTTPSSRDSTLGDWRRATGEKDARLEVNDLERRQGPSMKPADPTRGPT